MSCAHAMTWEQQVIARCTRDGHVLWPHVAAQLGVSVDVARSRLDPSYMRAHIWAPSREPQPEMLEIDTTPPADITDTSSPHNKGPGLKVAIIARLRLGPASAETIAAFIAHSVDSVRPRLSQMKADGMIEHSTRMPYTWSITGDARKPKDTLTGAEVSGVLAAETLADLGFDEGGLPDEPGWEARVKRQDKTGGDFRHHRLDLGAENYARMRAAKARKPKP